MLVIYLGESITVTVQPEAEADSQSTIEHDTSHSPSHESEISDSDTDNTKSTRTASRYGRSDQALGRHSPIETKSPKRARIKEEDNRSSWTRPELNAFRSVNGGYGLRSGQPSQTATDGTTHSRGL